MTEQRHTLIAYFSILRIPNSDGYVGGMLVLDQRGVPMEFRCTLPVRPTQAQKALYGNTLEPYVFNQLIGLPLTQALTNQPVCYIVKNTMLLELREYIDSPVVHIEQYGGSLSTSDSSTPDSHIQLRSDTAGLQPITARFMNGYESDYEMVRERLEETFKRIDLLEPFERITTAFSVLSERDDRFK